MQTLKKEKEDLTKERDEQLDEISAVRQKLDIRHILTYTSFLPPPPPMHAHAAP